MADERPDVPPEETPAEGEAPDPNTPRCHRCGAPHDRFQEYCLECGARLTPLPQASFMRRDTWTGGSPYWFWATLLALLAIALVTTAVVIAATRDDKKAAVSSSEALPSTVVPTGLTTLPIEPTTIDTIPTLPTTTTFPTTFGSTTSVPTTTSTPTTTGNAELTEWPSGQSGWTVILESVPESQGRSTAESKANAAQSKGLAQVGVLRTNDYQGLTPGYWAVFSGIKNSKSEAEASLPSAKSAGYPSAYVRQIVPK